MTALPDSMRPGVFTDTSVYTVGSGGWEKSAVAICARAADGYAGAALLPITCAADAAVFGGNSPIYEMALTVLAAGCFPFYAAPVSGAGDYTAALAQLAPYGEIRAVACDGAAAAVGVHVDACRAAGRERVGLVGVSSAVTAVEIAAATDNARVVMVCDGGGHTHRTAAAFAVAIAGAPLGGLSGLAVPLDVPFDGTLTAAQIETLLHGGVTPFELCGSEVQCVRAMTTSHTRGGVSDRTFSDLSTVLAVDEVVSRVRGAVRARLRGLRNSEVTRQSIASQITVELEGCRARGVIDSFLPPRVAAHPLDATVCVATLAMRVAPEVNQILISTEISV